SDFPEYYAPARLIVEGRGADGYVLSALGSKQHDLYPLMGERIVPLFVPPPGLILLAPLGLFPHTVAPILWRLLLLVCLIGALIVLKRDYRLNLKETSYFTAATFLSGAAFESLRIDQLAPIILLLFCLSLQYFRADRPMVAGVLLSVLVFKPQHLLPFVAALAGGRRWKTLLALAATVGALSLISLIVLGAAGIQNYLDLVKAPEVAHYMQAQLGANVRGQLLRLMPDATGLIWTISGITMLAGVILSFVMGRLMSAKEHFVEWMVLLTVPLGLLISPHCHNYDHLLLLPPILFIFKNVVRPFGEIYKTLVMLCGLIFVVPFSIFIHYFYILPGGLLNPYFFALLLFVAANIISSRQWITGGAALQETQKPSGNA
ncbi:MAG TPA: glycosyltransferase family 87 protein, partial [Candidatus Obscuribacterales bacterium]